jgi:hypothetical protein
MADSNTYSRRSVEDQSKLLKIIALTLVGVTGVLLLAGLFYACAKTHKRRKAEYDVAQLVPDIELGKRRAGGVTSKNGNSASQPSTFNRDGLEDVDLTR